MASSSQCVELYIETADSAYPGQTMCNQIAQARSRGYKKFMLNSAEHEILNASKA